MHFRKLKNQLQWKTFAQKWENFKNGLYPKFEKILQKEQTIKHGLITLNDASLKKSIIYM